MVQIKRKKKRGSYVSVVEITPSEDNNILWNFWTDESQSIERYLQKFRQEKTRIIQAGGATVSSYSSQPDTSAGVGKPESLSGSQPDKAGSDLNIPPSAAIKARWNYRGEYPTRGQCPHRLNSRAS